MLFLISDYNRIKMERISLPNNTNIQKLHQHLIAFLDNETYDVLTIATSADEITLRVINDRRLRSGSKISLRIVLHRTTDEVQVDIGDPEWVNIAGSLGATLIGAVINPINLLGRIDDLSVDVINFQLVDRVKQLLTEIAAAAIEADRRRIERSRCKYCGSRNIDEVSHCASCGAPLL